MTRLILCTFRKNFTAMEMSAIGQKPPPDLALQWPHTHTPSQSRHNKHTQPIEGHSKPAMMEAAAQVDAPAALKGQLGSHCTAQHQASRKPRVKSRAVPSALAQWYT